MSFRDPLALTEPPELAPECLERLDRSEKDKVGSGLGTRLLILLSDEALG